MQLLLDAQKLHLLQHTQSCSLQQRERILPVHWMCSSPTLLSFWLHSKAFTFHLHTPKRHVTFGAVQQKTSLMWGSANSKLSMRLLTVSWKMMPGLLNAQAHQDCLVLTFAKGQNDAALHRGAPHIDDGWYPKVTKTSGSC